jgi:hypothetical protein
MVILKYGHQWWLSAKNTELNEDHQPKIRT